MWRAPAHMTQESLSNIDQDLIQHSMLLQQNLSEHHVRIADLGGQIVSKLEQHCAETQQMLLGKQGQQAARLWTDLVCVHLLSAKAAKDSSAAARHKAALVKCMQRSPSSGRAVCLTISWLRPAQLSLRIRHP